MTTFGDAPTTAGDWRDRAACRAYPAEYWDTGDPNNALALRICRACPVLDECGDQASSDPHPVGVVLAGVVYTGTGKPAAACVKCSMPILGRRAGATRCLRCSAPKKRAAAPTITPELVDAARLLREQLIAAGRPAGAKALATALRNQGWRLSWATSDALRKLLRDEHDPNRSPQHAATGRRQRTPRSSRFERSAILREMVENREPDDAIAARLGIKVTSVQRHKQRHGLAAGTVGRAA